MSSAAQPAPVLRRDSDDPWEAALADVFSGHGSTETAFQPIADLARGVVAGYEALSRFPSQRIQAPPDHWFRHAERLGCGEALDALALTGALTARSKLPPNTFLTLNVTPVLLQSACWDPIIRSFGDLSGVVVELTENTAISDYGAVRQRIAEIRRRGGLFAVDDAGAGYASLQHVLALRPDFIKLDRVFIMDCDRDAARLALIEMLGAFAGKLDAWVIAEGVERQEEMEELMRLRIPLAQGYLFGRPAGPWSNLPDPLVPAMLAAAQRASLRGQALWAADSIPQVGTTEQAWNMLAAESHRPAVAVTDAHQRPLQLLYRHPRAGICTVEQPMRIKVDSPLAEVLARAAARPERNRFDPLVVTNEEGKLVGFVPLDRLIRAVVTDPSESPAHSTGPGHSIH